ncbi:hypothetical protein [Bacillus sp. FSL K6-3431]|uniref:hypothetical protein n=1 Tax=Bacillus sp. FSL K6-3431 TaxID=2921500 RepID=UPI0030F739B2
MKKVLFFCLLLLTGCTNTTPNLMIEWVDFIHINDEIYEVAYRLEIADPILIGGKLGEITFNIADNIHDSEYRSKNGDATYLLPGTEVFSVNNEGNLVAIKDPDTLNGYKIYTKKNPAELNDFAMFAKNDIIKADIFFETSYKQFDLNRSITDHEQIEQIMNNLQSGRPGATNGYNDNNPQFQSYAILLYTSSSVARKYSIFFDGERYSWSPWDSEVLPSEIANFLNSNELVPAS